MARTLLFAHSRSAAAGRVTPPRTTATLTHDNEEYRPGDPVVLVRLFDRTGADTRRFTVRIYRERQERSPSSTGDGREDQPVVGGTTAVAPRATYTITSAAERAITTAAAH
ncbi:hypothetical protein JL720_5384 [Aureococcus anophagefferens]|nr:hypothetical protein JL720_5384 [Aureococcus anophagefferens]